jgi:threonine synthase
MAQAMGEAVLCTISTGNMGHSVAAYTARSGLGAIVFVPEFATREKLASMSIHGATVMRVHAPDYSAMKRYVLDLAGRLRVRIVSGNGPVRVEGYKLTAFEMFEQMEAMKKMGPLRHILKMFPGVGNSYLTMLQLTRLKID